MRVFVVTPWFPTPANPGAGIFNLRDAELLAEDHDVRVVHLHDPALPGGADEWTSEHGIPVKRIAFSSSRPDTWPGAIAEIREGAEASDLVHTMAFPAIFPVRLARIERPWVHTEHWSGLVGNATTLRAKLGGAALKPGLRRPDEVVAVGQPLADAIDAVRGSGRRARASRTTVIANEVRFAPAGRLPAAPEERGSAPLRVAAVGNLIPTKGPIELVGAIAELAQRGVPAELTWAGSGPLADAVTDEAARLGIDDAVTLAGHVGAAELSDLLLGSHVFALPTVRETFGVAIAEALAHGLPVVATGAGGHRAFLPAEASRTPEARDPKALADALEALVEDPDRWAPEQIIEAATAMFSQTQRRSAYRRVYDAAIQRAARRAR